MKKHVERRVSAFVPVSRGNDILSDYGERVVDAAYRIRAKSLYDVLCACIRLEGMTVPRGKRLRDDPGRVFDGLSARDPFERRQQTTTEGVSSRNRSSQHDSVRKATSTISRKTSGSRLTDVGDLEPVAADGEIKDGGVREDKATNQLDHLRQKVRADSQDDHQRRSRRLYEVPNFDGQPGPLGLIDQLFFPATCFSNPTQGR